MLSKTLKALIIVVLSITLSTVYAFGLTYNYTSNPYMEGTQTYNLTISLSLLEALQPNFSAAENTTDTASNFNALPGTVYAGNAINLNTLPGFSLVMHDSYNLLVGTEVITAQLYATDGLGLPSSWQIKTSTQDNTWDLISYKNHFIGSHASIRFLESDYSISNETSTIYHSADFGIPDSKGWSSGGSTPVPEPSGIILLGVGIAGVVGAKLLKFLRQLNRSATPQQR